MRPQSRSSCIVLLVLCPSASSALDPQNNPGSAAAQQQRDAAWSEIYQRAKSGGPDGVVADQLADPLGSSIPAVPNLKSFSPTEELIDVLGEQLSKAFDSRVKNDMLKNAPGQGPVANFADQVQHTLDLMDPRAAAQAKARADLDKDKMAQDFTNPNMAYCKGIPPITCNPVGPASYECAGGPRAYNSQGIPPWDYTLVAKCNGRQFLSFDSFEPRASARTIVPATSDGRGGITYHGRAHAAFCVPCPQAAPVDIGKVFGNFVDQLFGGGAGNRRR